MRQLEVKMLSAAAADLSSTEAGMQDVSAAHAKSSRSSS